MSIIWSSTVLCLALVSLSAPMPGDWKVDVRKDSMTDKTISTAVGTNSDGFTLKLQRIEDGSIWATFRLPDANGEILSTQLPMYRVDKKEPNDMDELAKAFATFSLTPNHQREPKWVSFKVFTGEGAPNAGTLRDLMDGTVVVFRYYLATGGYKETSFSLVGAKQVIADAVKVPPEADLAAAAKTAAFHEAMSEDSDRCFAISNNRRRQACLDKHWKCVEEAARDAEKFRACLQ